jgi:N-dimethylarginine dimethylaminohydrolase
MSKPLFLMTDPGHYDVSYRINPWMKPEAWEASRRRQAQAASRNLRLALEAAGAEVEMLPGVAGLPDLVFPANAAVVLDGVALLARFRHPERQGEEAPFRRAFEAFKARGLIRRIVELPPGCLHEGAGDAHWDEARQLFWTGHGPRSSLEGCRVVAETFGKPVVELELASDRFYHLDTCFCPLADGDVLYFPDAFAPQALAAIRARVPAHRRIEADAAEAAAFCVNAVRIDRTLIMARAPASLRAKLEERGYRLVEVDLDPFILSGGAAYCMTLRVDRRSAPALAPAPA